MKLTEQRAVFLSDAKKSRLVAAAGVSVRSDENLRVERRRSEGHEVMKGADQQSYWFFSE